jgi:hypothetical protein
VRTAKTLRQFGFYCLLMPARSPTFNTFGCLQSFLDGVSRWKSESTCTCFRCAAKSERSDTIDSFALILRGCGRLQMEREGCHFGQAAKANGDEYELFGIKFNQF